jgi:hypothetical protein
MVITIVNNEQGICSSTYKSGMFSVSPQKDYLTFEEQ